MYLPVSFPKQGYTKEQACSEYTKIFKRNVQLLEVFGLTFAKGSFEETEDEYSFVVAFASGNVELNEQQKDLYFKFMTESDKYVQQLHKENK